MSKLCDECETVAHCMTHGCIPKRDFWAGYVPEPVKPAQQAFDKKAENARELGLDYEPAQQKQHMNITTTYDEAMVKAMIAEAVAKERNATLDEIATKIAAMPFGDTAASFSVWIREQKT